MSQYGPALNGDGSVVEAYRPGFSEPDSNPPVPNSRIAIAVNKIAGEWVTVLQAAVA
jgi:hypothetical protein